MLTRVALRRTVSDGLAPRRIRRWLAPAALVLLPGVVFLQAALLRGVFFFGDVQSYFYPYHALPAALLGRGELPLWNPYVFGGIPLIGDGQTALYYPPNWLFFILKGGAALNFDTLVQFSVAGLGMYLLLRTLGLWRLPAFLGSVAYMFCGSLTARVFHLSNLSGSALMPFALLCVEMAFRGRPGLAPHGPATAGRTRWFVASAAVIGVQVFTGHPQIPVYTAMMLGLYAFVRGVECWRGSGSPRWLWRMPFVVAGMYLLGGGLAAIHLVPWAEAGALSTRAAGISFDQVFGTSVARSDWLLHVFPYLYGSFRVGVYADQPIPVSLSVRFLEHSAYVGMLPLGLAAYGLLGLRSLRAAGSASRPAFYSVLFFMLLAILGLLLAAGWATPLAHVVYRMPVIGKLRAVERALVLTTFAVAALAAFGVQRLIGAGSRAGGRHRWSLAAIGACMAALPVAVVLVTPMPWFQQAMNLPTEAAANLLLHRPNAFVPIVLAVASGALLMWWSRYAPTRATLAVATGLILVDLGGYAALYNPIAEPEFYEQRPDVLSALHGSPGHFRKATFLPRNDLNPRTPQALLAMSWGMVYGVEDINGFNSLQPRRYTDYVFGPSEGDVSYGLLGDDRLLRPESPILSSLNVRYVLLPAGSPLSVGSSYRRVWENADVVVYENTLAYPRAFFAETVRAVTDPTAILRAVTADGFDGRTLALVETDAFPALPAPSGPDAVTLAAWKPNRVSVTYTAATPRFLVLSEMYFPGWQATVDGAATPIYRTNYLFRGVVVPAGRHTVTFDYRPRSVLIGAALSGFAFVVALLMLFTSRRSR